MELSQSAQNVISALKEVDSHSLTSSYLSEPIDGFKWLPACNIVNGHVENVPEEYVTLVGKLLTVVDKELISEEGQNSFTYYELKDKGFKIWNPSRDRFGPLSTAIYYQEGDWMVSFG